MVSTNRLEDITDEVNDLHPLLEQLLPKLPGVKEVEYTHGNREMGADFVFSRSDDALDSTGYVGVIAKLGAIRQDHSAIARQIDECAVPRLFQAGKKRIHLDEIWVIVTGTVTQNAQDKIHETYRLRNIHFVNGAQLERLIDKHLPVFWTDVPLEIGSYLTTLRHEVHELDTILSLVPATDSPLYIEPDIQKTEIVPYQLQYRRPKPPVHIDIREEIRRVPVLIIEAPLGLGKSALLRHLAAHYTSPEAFKRDPVLPIFVSYKELIDQHDGDVDALLTAHQVAAFTQSTKDTKFLLLIDAFDEVNLTPEEQAKSLAGVISQIHRDSSLRAVIASRPLRVFDQPDVMRGVHHRYRICALSFTKTLEFIKAVCTELNVTTKLIADLRKSQLFKELPRSPITAILLARLLNENPRDLPSNITELYSQYLEQILGRWDIKKGLQTQKEYTALDNIMSDIARYAMDNGSHAIPMGDVKQIFANYLTVRHLEIDPESLLNQLIERCDVMGTDTDQNILMFKHRSFAEFFYAKALFRQRVVEIDGRVFQPYWMNTFFFLLGLVTDSPKLVENISNLAPATELERWVKTINMSNYLLAAYATPYDAIRIALEKTMIETSVLYQDTVSGKCSSPFTALSQMQLLYLLQAMVRYSYSYKFFLKAMEETALEIDQGDYDTETKAYALFFLAVAYLEAGGKESFDFILTNHTGNLPLDLSLALSVETKSLKEKSSLVKKQDKYTKRFLKDHPHLRETIKNMFSRPIKGEEG